MNDENDIAAYRRFVKERLESIVPVFAKAAIGDFSENVNLPEHDDEFAEFFVGVQLVLEVAREQLAELKELNQTLEKKVEQRTEEIIRREELLRAQTERYETLLRAQSEMGEGVAITEGSNFIYCNDALQKLYGYSLEELQKMSSFFEIVAPELRDELMQRLRQRLNHENSSDSGETIIIRKDGQRINIQYSLKPVVSGGKTQLISIIRDVTKRKQTEEFLKKEKDRSERAELARNVSEMFLANISHEIRTPMNAIVGFARLLIQSPLNGEQKEYADIIRSSGENLLVIINDLLDLSRLQEGKIQLEKHDFNIPKIVNDALRVFSVTANQKGIELESQIDPRLEISLIGDPVRLGQILLNLLSNALKFTERGKISVYCTMLDEKEDHVETGFTISDTGVGISMNELPYIFDRFGKANRSDWKKHEGTGIGLAISRHLVELQGGEISVNSKLNEGTSFHFTLAYEKANCKKPESNKIYEAEKKLSGGRTSSLRILLVEDNEMNRELMRILFQKKQITIDMAEDGRIALKMLEKNKYDVILMDIKLPEMDGYEVTRRIRIINQWKNVPVIAVTAHAIEGEKEKCLAAGMNDYVSKPVDPDELYSKIIYWTGKKRKPAKKTEKTPAKKNNFKVIDLRYLEKITHNDKEMQQELIRIFSVNAPKMIRKMSKLAEKKKNNELGELAHKFRSGAGNIFRKEKMKMVEQLEDQCRKNSLKKNLAEIGKLRQMTLIALKELEQLDFIK
ncbi:MAG: response regulator [Bacteroidetes bacterium]|nr:response regulator [Bacteroidota bacterium]